MAGEDACFGRFWQSISFAEGFGAQALSGLDMRPEGGLSNPARKLSHLPTMANLDNLLLWDLHCPPMHANHNLRPRLLPGTILNKLCPPALILAVIGLAMREAQAWQAPALPAPQDARLAGPWAAAQALNAERMAAAPLDQPEFILDDVALKQHRKFAEYSGDISGRWIGAAAFLAPQFPKAFAAFPTVMAGFPLYQKADGHFGADQQLPKIERGRDMPILWGNGRLLIGLVEVYDRTGDTNALVLAKRLGDYFVATDPVYDKAENIRSVGGSYADGFVTCYFSCIEGPGRPGPRDQGPALPGRGAAHCRAGCHRSPISMASTATAGSAPCAGSPTSTP